jgi:CheY-like chemotaxis protein
MAKILVVDDEPVIVKGIKFNLEREGYQVETGFDGEQAVELARGSSFDLIILDLMMPKIDGLQACARIREFSDVPIVMLTARSEDTDKLIGFEYGADAVKVLCSSKDFDKVVKAVPVPVVMAGGPKTASLEDIVKYSVECGGKGCAIGRNVYGSEDPAARIKALRAIVHGE